MYTENDIHVMVDLETMGTKVDSAIASIAIVAFNLDGMLSSFEGTPELYTRIDLGTTTGKCYPDTVLWWMKQSETARAEITWDGYKAIEIIAIQTVEDYIRDWAGQAKYKGGKLYIWAKSPSFDLEILKKVFDTYALKTPWDFRNERDVRTITAMFPAIPFVAPVVSHHALYDARAQADQVIECLRRVKVLELAEAMQAESPGTQSSPEPEPKEPE